MATSPQSTACPTAPDPAASDEALIARLWAGDETALETLLGRYRDLIRHRARRYYMVGADKEDVVQEAMIGLFKAITSFDSTRGAPFAAFATTCVTNEIQRAVQRSQRHKHGPLNTAVSLETQTVSGDTLQRYEVSADVQDPAEEIVARDDVAALKEHCEQALSGLERDALLTYLDGHSYDVIGRRLGCAPKTVDNALRRARKKIGGYLAAREAAALV